MSDPAIDEKICKGDSGSTFDTNTNAKCTGAGSNGVYASQQAGLSNFAELSIAKDPANWPKGTTARNHDNAKNVSDDLMKLTKDEKAVVAKVTGLCMVSGTLTTEPLNHLL